MNLKKILLVAGLALSAGASACAAVALMPNDSKPAIETKAASGDAWHIRGSMNGWEADGDYQILENTTPKTLFLDAGLTFKVSKGTVWGTELTTASGTAESQKDISFSYGNDSTVNTTALYTFSVTSNNDVASLIVDTIDTSTHWVYIGTDTEKTGAESGWANGRSHYLDDGGSAATWSMKANEKFKLTNKFYSWGDVYGCSLNGSASSEFYIDTDDHDNIVCRYAGDYTFQLASGTLYIDYADGTEFYYHGTDAGKAGAAWTDWTAHPVTVNGPAVEFSLAKDEEFGLRSPGGTFYGYTKKSDDYFNCFGVSGNNFKMNLTYDRYTLAVTVVGHELHIVPSAVGQSYKTNYVLDLNGDLLNSNPRAHLWTGVVGDTYPPGMAMTAVSGYSNIFGITYWDEFKSLIFANGTTNTIDYTSHADGECLVLGWSYSGGKWDSNSWVSLEAAEYISTYLKFNDENGHENAESSGLCTSSGWYTAARDAYKLLGKSVQQSICSCDLALSRLVAWAKANNESFELNNDVYVFGASSNNFAGFVARSSSDNASLIVVISVAAIATAAGAFYFLRRKEN